MLPVSICLPKNPSTDETFQKHNGGVALKKPLLSLPFSFSEGSISRLPWDGKGTATGAGRRRWQPVVLHHPQPQKSS